MQRGFGSFLYIQYYVTLWILLQTNLCYKSFLCIKFKQTYYYSSNIVHYATVVFNEFYFLFCPYTTLQPRCRSLSSDHRAFVIRRFYATGESVTHSQQEFCRHCKCSAAWIDSGWKYNFEMDAKYERNGISIEKGISRKRSPSHFTSNVTRFNASLQGTSGKMYFNQKCVIQAM